MPRLSKIGAAALAAFGWTSGSAVTADFLVIAGGGGSGKNASAGGGAGGYRTSAGTSGGGASAEGKLSLNPTQSYTVTVGAGGAGATNSQGTNGSNSVFSTITSTGGGGGAGYQGSGSSGGSGGGGGGYSSGSPVGGAGTANQGYAGGNGSFDSGGASANMWGGGGGGAGGVGGNATNSAGGTAGAGVSSSINGTATTRALGGVGGGGATGFDGTAGGANTGTGGGGSGFINNGAAGGSGVVIVRYAGPQQFGGGVVTSSGGNTIHTFTTSGTLSPLSSLTASALVVAGGGGGAYDRGGGGGAGGLQTPTGLTIDTNSIYVVTVGSGGAGSTTNANGSNGTNSSFSAYATASVGGGGGASYVTAGGSTGGSGGGGSYTNTGGAGTSGQGNAGGNGESSVYINGGGGGGAGAAGQTPANSSNGGNGGNGSASSISGSSVTYAGGGGGGHDTRAGGSAGTGGTGGGGAGGMTSAGTAGTANTGGGGGGGGNNGGSSPQNGGAGGSGVVIISYPGSTQQMAGGTVTVAGGNVIHTFTSSGYLTPIVLVNNSLRFRSSASAYLSRTFPVAGNRRTYTLSLWVKRGSLGGSTNQVFFGSGVSTTAGSFYFLPTDQLEINPRVNNTNTYITTTQVFRDPSAWYHIVIALDTTQATDSNRLKLYINGVQVTAFSATIYPALNGDSTLNNNIAHWIGRYPEPGFPSPFDGYLAEYNFIDGQALTPNSFGTFNGLGVWQPIRYGGSYGTNGFYLPFTDTTSTSTLGTDFSGNSNTWTVNNISLTSGSTYDSMTDVPTLTSATTANYCVMNPLNQNSTGVTIASGNLNVNRASSSNGQVWSTMGMTSGKWYAEVTIGDRFEFVPGIANGNMVGANRYLGQDSNTWGFYNNGQKINSGSYTAYGNSYTDGDVIGVAFDADIGSLYFYINGIVQNSGTAAFTGLTSSPYFFACSSESSTTASSWNFGQRPFAYTPPTGFVALNTYNLPTPTIGATASTTANKYMDVTTYTGNGAARNIINSGSMQPDWVWLKSRVSSVWNHQLYDVLRAPLNSLSSNTTDATYTYTDTLTAFNSNGFSLGTDATWNGPVNKNGDTYVAWQWKANGSGSTNTAGSITSTVSANTTAGFSIVTYTGTGANATVGHGLGVAPSWVIVKRRSNTGNWYVYSISTGNTNRLRLDESSASTAESAAWNNTSPTSTVFSIGTSVDVNASGNTYVAYCFAQVAGYSAFGSYTGNGSTDGPFIFTGFRPRFIMFKVTSTTNIWIIHDTARDTYNVSGSSLLPNASDAEYSNNQNMDILSNGFKLRSTDSATNQSGQTFIYMAFAEVPYKFSNAR